MRGARPWSCSSITGVIVTTPVLDAKGLNCPLPILRAKKALHGVPTGGLLEVHATDPGSVRDFEAFCRQTGNELVEQSQEDAVFRFLIKHTAA